CGRYRAASSGGLPVRDSRDDQVNGQDVVKSECLGRIVGGIGDGERKGGGSAIGKRSGAERLYYDCRSSLRGSIRRNPKEQPQTQHPEKCAHVKSTAPGCHAIS